MKSGDSSVDWGPEACSNRNESQVRSAKWMSTFGVFDPIMTFWKSNTIDDDPSDNTVGAFSHRARREDCLEVVLAPGMGSRSRREAPRPAHQYNWREGSGAGPGTR